MWKLKTTKSECSFFLKDIVSTAPGTKNFLKTYENGKKKRLYKYHF